jgi:hypothetical protein
VTQVSGEDRQVPDRAALSRRKTHGQAAMDDRVVRFLLELGVGVRHRDRTREASVGRTRDRVPLGLFHRQAVCRDDRLAFERIRQEHERRVSALQRSAGLERPRQDVVEVDRIGELAEDPLPSALLLAATLSFHLSDPGSPRLHPL